MSVTQHQCRMPPSDPSNYSVQKSTNYQSVQGWSVWNLFSAHLLTSAVPFHSDKTDKMQ